MGVEPWDTEWAAVKAAEALRYLARNYPECLANLRVLDEHETATHEAAVRGDRDAGTESLTCSVRFSTSPVGSTTSCFLSPVSTFFTVFTASPVCSAISHG